MNLRLKKLKEVLLKEKLGGLLVSSPENIAYFCGFWGLSPEQHESFLLVTSKNSYLLTDGRYIEAVKQLNTGFKPILTTPNESAFQIIAKLTLKLKIGRLGFEKVNLTVAEFFNLKKNVKSKKLVPTHNLVEGLRAIKEKREILFIQKAVKLADQTFNYILKKIKPGVSETEIAWEIEKFVRERGAQLAFPPIVASGQNSAIPHHRTSDKRLKTKDIILLDFGAKIDNYCSDLTRVIFLGKATDEQKKVYQVVLEAQKRALEFLNHESSIINNRLKASAIDRVARDYITSHGYPTIPHSVGHGIGLSCHELPRLGIKSADTLKPRMVHSVEPGIYIPGKFGVRIEDLVLITSSGPKILTQSPKEIIENKNLDLGFRIV